jgi:gliding motility-associated-like protein
MKYLIIPVICVIIAVGIITCKKSSESTPPAAPCPTCNFNSIEHTKDGTGLYYFLPTAFTPNGDGINDVFGVISSGLNADSSRISIWNLSGKGVYLGNINHTWNGNDLSGNKCPAGKYTVNVRIWVGSTEVVNTCTCVSILTYKGTCIYTGGYAYKLPDQLDPAMGFVNTTNENLCP